MKKIILGLVLVILSTSVFASISSDRDEVIKNVVNGACVRIGSSRTICEGNTILIDYSGEQQIGILEKIISANKAKVHIPAENFLGYISKVVELNQIFEEIECNKDACETDSRTYESYWNGKRYLFSDPQGYAAVGIIAKLFSNDIAYIRYTIKDDQFTKTLKENFVKTSQLNEVQSTEDYKHVHYLDKNGKDREGWIDFVGSKFARAQRTKHGSSDEHAEYLSNVVSLSDLSDEVKCSTAPKIICKGDAVTYEIKPGEKRVGIVETVFKNNKLLIQYQNHSMWDLTSRDIWQHTSTVKKLN